MRGFIRKRGSTWEYILELGKQPAQRCTQCNKRHWVDRTRLVVCPECDGELRDTEERRQKSQGGFRTRKEAQEALDKAKVAVAENRFVVMTNVTVRSFLLDEWLPTIKKTVRATTYASYEGHVRNHLVPRLGSIQLRRLNAATINAHYAYLSEEGNLRAKTKLDGGEIEHTGLSGASVRRVHATLHRALHDAVRWQRLHHNPADAADPPRASAERTERQVWSRDELKRFLKSAQNDDLYPLWLLYSTTGMRRGEALGLQWADIDLAAGSLSIRRSLVPVHGIPTPCEPKTKRGRRTISLDPTTVAVLKSHRRAQKEREMRNRDVWEQGDWVFTNDRGVPLDGNAITKAFSDLAKKAKLPHIPLHSLRHTYATLALGGGMNARDLSARLGHSTVAFTLDIYSHAIPAVEEEAAAKVAALFVP